MLVAITFVVAAAYFLFVQIAIPSSDGGSFWCSNAFSPPTDKFAAGVCRDAVHVYQLRASLLFVLGLLIVGLGVMFFGVSRRVEERLDGDLVTTSPEATQ